MKRSIFSKNEDRYILVVSWGGMRGFYWLWITKALEELWLREKIDAIYGVSAWWLLASYRAAGYNSEDILDIFFRSDFFDIKKDINLIPKNSILKVKEIEKQVKRDLPKSFEELKTPIYIGCTDTQKWQFTVLSTWNLASALMWTIAIPWVFPAVERGDEVLIDGGVTNNFPIKIAKKNFPDHKIIGISLNKYRKKPKIRNILDNLIVSFEIMLRKDIEPQWALADIFFCRELDTPVLEFNTSKLRKIYDLGYQDGLEQFKDII